MTTHSPHIASVAPLDTIVLFSRNYDPELSAVHTTASTPNIPYLSQRDIDDIERYLDVTRAEMLFARGVLLVEGEAEKYIVPRLAKSLGKEFNLDKLGISVCPIGCADFLPYVKLLGKGGLNIPFAILTDYDPQNDGRSLGAARVTNSLLYHLLPTETWNEYFPSRILDLAPDYGIFLNKYTLEVDLFRAGNHVTICDTIRELSENNAAKGRATGWMHDPGSLDPVSFLKDISEIGKGRFAQRLANKMEKATCPYYIEAGIKYLTCQCELQTPKLDIRVRV